MNHSNVAITPTHNKRSWPQAYKAFLLSKNESFILKIAPIVILLGTPEVLAGNLIPVVGELVDFGGLGLTLIVVVRTLLAVQKYRGDTRLTRPA